MPFQAEKELLDPNKNAEGWAYEAKTQDWYSDPLWRHKYPAITPMQRKAAEMAVSSNKFKEQIEKSTDLYSSEVLFPKPVQPGEPRPVVFLGLQFPHPTKYHGGRPTTAEVKEMLTVMVYLIIRIQIIHLKKILILINKKKL